MTPRIDGGPFFGQSLVVRLWYARALGRGGTGPLAEETRAGGGPVLNRLFVRSVDASYPYLAYVDEYDNTLFSKSQMAAVLPELERLSGMTRDDEEANEMAKILDLARRCATEPGFYFVFEGD